MSDYREEIISYVKGFKYISLYFGDKYLEKIINHYFNRKPKSPYYHLANSIVYDYGFKIVEFFYELEELLKHFYSEPHLMEYLLNPKVKNKLKSIDIVEFHSIWSEIIVAFYLHKKGYNISKIGLRNGEPTEIADIITDKGLFEVCVVLSDKDRYEDGKVFWGSNEISSEVKKIINSKIKNKQYQNDATYIIIDCTFMDSIADQLMSSAILNIPTDFQVFKKTFKRVFLFTRHNVTQQVGPIKEI